MTPLTAFITDKYGKRTLLLLISNILMVLVFIFWIILPTEGNW